MKNLVIIDINFNDSNARIKYKVYRLCKSKETPSYYYCYSNSGNNTFKRKKAKCNIIIEKEKTHYEFALLSDADKKTVAQEKDVIAAVNKIVDTAIVKINKYYLNLSKIQNEINGGN